MQFKVLCTSPNWALEDGLLVWMDRNPMRMDLKSSKAYLDLLNFGKSCGKMTTQMCLGKPWTIDTILGSCLIDHASTQSQYPFVFDIRILPSKLDNNFEFKIYVVQQRRCPWRVHNGWTLLYWPYSQSSSSIFCVHVDCYEGYTVLICARYEDHPKPIGSVKALFSKFVPTSPNFHQIEVESCRLSTKKNVMHLFRLGSKKEFQVENRLCIRVGLDKHIFHILCLKAAQELQIETITIPQNM